MRIGDLAARSGVSTRALRYYEENGLLSAGRSPSGQREYRATAVERVALIQQLYASGLTSADIRSLLPAIEARRSTPEIIAELRARRQQLAERIEQLTSTVARLDDVIAVATSPSDHCAEPEPVAGRAELVLSDEPAD